jgi:hypothetical protein|tara:strand:- start:209 stop:1018 length:810 start_codon:yes stop_codon:yes gene_type:complete
MGNAVANKKNAELSTDVLDDIFDTAGEGAVFDSSEMEIPFVRLIQALSPQISKKKPEYIEGASMGDIFNNVTKQFWSGEEGITVVPCFQKTAYLEFVPREQGGGFKGEISPSDPILQRTTRSGPKEILPHGNELVKSDQHFCLVLGEDGMYQLAVVDMKSSQLKHSRRWKTQIAMQKVKHPKTGAMVTPAVFATMWKLTSTEDSNDQGEWANYQVEKVGLVQDREILQAAKSFRDSIAAGEVKATSEDTGAASTDTASKAKDLEDEIPF